ISVGLLRNFYFATFFGFDVEERAKSFDYSSAGSSRFVFHSCDAYGMVVNRYLFGMTNPHERNRCCDNQSRKGRTWSLIPSFLSQQGYPCSKCEQHYKFTGILAAGREDWLSVASAQRARRRN
ncbi:MAG: hypothetical protein WAL11_12860, partial [Pseudolabrys sp.]